MKLTPLTHAAAAATAVLAAALLALALHTAPASAASLPAGSTALLSGGPSLSEALAAPVGRADSTAESVSGDGRFVTFSSTSDGLVDGDDDRVQNIYLRDMATGDVTLVSREDGAAGEPAHDDCKNPVISDDASRVAFVCEEPLDPADTNSYEDVYVRTRATGTTELVSRASGLGPVADTFSYSPSLSETGDYVAFSSYASNLGTSVFGSKVFRRRLGGGDETIIVSRSPAAAGGGVTSGDEASISDDGARIAFTTDTAIDAKDTNNTLDVYVRDVGADTTELASRKDGGGGDVGNGYSGWPAIAGDGTAVVFASRANQFDVDNDSDTRLDVYRRSLTARTTVLVDITAGGDKATSAFEPATDDSGMVVAFVSDATQLHPDDTDPAQDVYVKNLATNTVDVVTRADGVGGRVANAGARSAAVSGDGKKVVSELDAGGITPDSDPRRRGIFLRDLTSYATRSVARPPGTDPFVGQGGDSRSPVMSADGRYVAFSTAASGLGLPDAAVEGIVVRDRVSGAVTFASREDGPQGAPFTGAVHSPAISADGRRVAFVVEKTPGAVRQIWVRDVVAGTTSLASRADGANGAPGDGDSVSPAIDADGTRVAFASQAANLGDGDADDQQDVHVRDLESDATVLASRADGAAGPKGDLGSNRPDIDGSGNRVVFVSNATNLGDGDTDQISDAHVRDLAAGSTRLVSAVPGGAKGDADTLDPSIDAAGDRVAFATLAKNLGGAEAGAGAYVLDLGDDALKRIGAGRNPVVSPDGGYVAFEAENAPHVLWHDLATGRTQIASRGPGADGPATTSFLTLGDISSGGGCVSFDTTEPLIGPARDTQEAYVRALGADCARVLEPGAGGETPGGGAGGQGGPGGAGGGPGGPGGDDAGRDTAAPVLSDARLTRKRFRPARGTGLRFRSSEAGTLSLALERRGHAPRGRRSSRKPVTLTRTVAAGAGRLRLGRKVAGRRLRPGRYRLTLTVSDAAGNRSQAVRLRFRVVRRRGA